MEKVNVNLEHKYNNAANSLPEVSVQQKLQSFCEKQKILRVKISYYEWHSKKYICKCQQQHLFRNLWRASFKWGCLKSDMKQVTFSNKQQLSSSLAQLSQHKKLNVFPDSTSGYPKTSWPASQW